MCVCACVCVCVRVCVCLLMPLVCVFVIHNSQDKYFSLNDLQRHLRLENMIGIKFYSVFFIVVIFISNRLKTD